MSHNQIKCQITLPNDINKYIEHYKIEHNLTTKAEAVIYLLQEHKELECQHEWEEDVTDKSHFTCKKCQGSIYSDIKPNMRKKENDA